MSDPVGSGLAESLSHPGHNMTGLSPMAHELHAKRVELLKLMVPGLSRLAVLFNRNSPLYPVNVDRTRAVAERMSATADVEVLTTTAVDYLSWKNELPPGESMQHGVCVRRFPVASRRWVRSFGRLSERLYRTAHTLEDEIAWMIRQGPRTPELLAHLKENQPRFDAFVFFTSYRISTTVGWSAFYSISCRGRIGIVLRCMCCV